MEQPKLDNHRCVVHLSTDKYSKGRLRLVDSFCTTNSDIEIAFYTNEKHVGAMPHKKSMYAFKPYSLLAANKLGYTSLLWLDASMYVLKDLTPIFHQIERDGYYWQDSGWTNERWTTDNQKNHFGTNTGKMISSGVLGLDLKNPIGQEFLKRWKQAADDGMFNGSHEVTRHDQTCASLIIEQMGLKITPNETHWMYGKPEESYPENILLIANGIC